MTHFQVETKFRTIQTPIPHPQTNALLDRLADVEARSMHGQLPIVWDRAQGSTVFDPWGNRWIDFTSSIFVSNAGHGHPEIVGAITDTATKPLLHAYNYATRERIEFLETLIAHTPKSVEKAFLVSAGTESVEAAIKLMKLKAKSSGKRRAIIVVCSGNWHGRTLGAQQLSSDKVQRNWIGYEDPDILHLPFPYPWVTHAWEDPEGFLLESLNDALSHAKATLEEDVAGFLLESYQGWGAFFYPEKYVQRIAAIATEGQALLAFDEMQSGFGRTGTFFAYEHYSVEADLVCCGKGASSSLPLAFVAGRRGILDLPEVGSMSSTHSAHPVVCAAGLANLLVIEREGLVNRAAELGRTFHAELNEMAESSPIVSSVQGRGLVAAVLFNSRGDDDASAVATHVAMKCLERGLLVVHTGRESIKLAPPLSIDEEALREGLEVFCSVVRSQ